MLVGHKDKIKIFKRLIKDESLSHGYLFFGESGVGKTAFAKSLANAIEKGRFDMPEEALIESIVISPQEGSIGIDEVRTLKKFLFQKPTSSKKRIAIVKQSERLTPQAQNAVLKIAEEPPQSGILILTIKSTDALLPTLVSRLQTVHFGNVDEEEIIPLLEQSHGVSKAEAKKIASLSLGKPGRAVSMINDEKFQEATKLADQYLKGSLSRRDAAERLSEDQELMDIFVSHLLAKLHEDPLANHEVMSKLIERVGKIENFSTNKRLQLESALWRN